MHLLLIGPDWQITARFRRELVTDMLAAGWRVTVAAGAGGEAEGARMFRELGAECISLSSTRTGINPLTDLTMALEVLRLCRRVRPDAALAFTVKPVTFGLIGAALALTPLRAAMITGFGYALMDGRGLKRSIIRFIVTTLYRISLGGAHRIVFQNDDDRADFAGLGLLPKAARLVRTNGSGVDLDRYRAAPLPDGPLTFVMVARLLREKGVYEFVEAAALIKAKYPDTRFVLVGPLDSNPTAISAEEADEWARAGVIDYVGPQADVRPFLADAHVFVLPSYREGTPRSALEALATGRPVLTVDVPGCREVVKDGVTGRLVEVRSATAIAEAMQWFHDRRGGLEELSTAARRDAEERFDVRVVNRVIMDAVSDGPSVADAA